MPAIPPSADARATAIAVAWDIVSTTHQEELKYDAACARKRGALVGELAKTILLATHATAGNGWKAVDADEPRFGAGEL